jgi:hypothetical protein
MPFDTSVLFHNLKDCGAITDQELKIGVTESHESAPLRRKRAASGAGNQNRVRMCVHYVDWTKAAQGNDNCAENLKPAECMSAEEIAGKGKIAMGHWKRREEEEAQREVAASKSGA